MREYIALIETSQDFGFPAPNTMDMSGQARAQQRKPTGAGGTKAMPFPPAQASEWDKVPQQAAQPKQWPTTLAAIKAFQTANKLTPDGLIGDKTSAALKAQGYKAPDKFQTVANRPTTVLPAQAGQPAKSDPNVLAMQQELIKRGYPLNATGVMDAKTQQAHDWELSSSNISSGLSSVQQATTPSATPANAQSLWNQAATKPTPVSEHVAFGQDQSLARIVDLINYSNK